MKLIADLRSDTVTRPDARMRRAMAKAVVGDDVYGEDPTVNELQQRTAAMFGHEAGLFTPTGSMANQIAIACLVKPGQELLADSGAHVLRAELGAAAAFGGITTRTWVGDGVVDPRAVMAMARPDSGPLLVSTAAIAVENTHNFAGGRIQPVDRLRDLHDSARSVGLLLHLDGARIWEAHAATGVPLQEYGKLFDTISVCLSKGLGAPVGSLVLGSERTIAKARTLRKRLGGGMRQVGVLAAAGAVALDNITDLPHTHEQARLLAAAVAAAAPGVIGPAPETNIVMLDFSEHRLHAREAAAAAGRRGVLISVLGPSHARLVTHRDLTDVAVHRAAEVLAKVLRR